MEKRPKDLQQSNFHSNLRTHHFLLLIIASAKLELNQCEMGVRPVWIDVSGRCSFFFVQARDCFEGWAGRGRFARTKMGARRWDDITGQPL